MPKLRRFNKKNQVNIKNIFASFIIIIVALTIGYISKSYAIYKLQQDYDVIKNKIGTYSMGDVRVAVLVDGKETDTFPTYETNYKVEKIECTNGVTATFDVENWQINIADMSATSTKCTVSFNSKETNEITPVNMSKTELLSLNEKITNTTAEDLKLELSNIFYPVGSIYMSTEDDTVEKVQEKFGGTWVKYSEGRMLIGASETYPVNSTGGSNSVTLLTENLPSHSHSFTASGKVSSTFTGTTVNSSSNGGHSHTVYGLWANSTLNSGVRLALQGDGNMVLYNSANKSLWQSGTVGNTGNSYRNIELGGDGATSYFDNHYHSVTAKGTIKSTFTGTAGNTSNTGSGTDVNVQNPYTAVYMYKRTA